MPGGQPTKFTPDRIERLLSAIRGGNYRQTACAYAGISHQTLRNWIKIAQGPDAPPEYVEFFEALEKAEADAEVFDIALIRQAAQGGSWQAAAWIRERKAPDRWGRKDASKVEVTGPDGGPVDLKVTLGVDQTAIEGLALALAARQEQRALAEPVVDAEVVE